MRHQDRGIKDHIRFNDAPVHRVREKAFIFFIGPSDIDLPTFNNLQEQSDSEVCHELPMIQNWLSKGINTKSLPVQPQRGDLIKVSWLSYRNNGLYIIDQQNNQPVVKDLFYDVDDYGSLPPNFTLDQFPPCYHDAIAHNNIRWLSRQNIYYDLEGGLEYCVPSHLFVPNKTGKEDLLPRPYLKIRTANNIEFHVIGVYDGDEENAHVRKHQFMTLFINHFNKDDNILFHSVDPAYGCSQLQMPQHTLFVYCY